MLCKIAHINDTINVDTSPFHVDFCQNENARILEVSVQLIECFKSKDNPLINTFWGEQLFREEYLGVNNYGLFDYVSIIDSCIHDTTIKYAKVFILVKIDEIPLICSCLEKDEYVLCNISRMVENESYFSDIVYFQHEYNTKAFFSLPEWAAFLHQTIDRVTTSCKRDTISNQQKKNVQYEIEGRENNLYVYERENCFSPGNAIIQKLEACRMYVLVEKTDTNYHIVFLRDQSCQTWIIHAEDVILKQINPESFIVAIITNAPNKIELLFHTDKNGEVLFDTKETVYIYNEEKNQWAYNSTIKSVYKNTIPWVVEEIHGDTTLIKTTRGGLDRNGEYVFGAVNNQNANNILTRWYTAAQSVSELDVDTVFCVTVHYFINDHAEPETHTSLLPIHETCYLNITNHDTLIKSLNKGAYPVGDFFFSLFPMIKASFPDSSEVFQKVVYDESLSRWLHYNIKRGAGEKFYTKTGDLFIITIAKVMAITKHNVNGFPLAVGLIKDVVPVSLNDNCIKDEMIVISETVLHEM